MIALIVLIVLMVVLLRSPCLIDAGVVLTTPTTRRPLRELNNDPKQRNGALPALHQDRPIAHEPARGAIAHIDDSAGEDEVVSIDLSVYGQVPAPGEVFVKDRSDDLGFVAPLQEAGVVEILGDGLVDLFRSRV